VTDAKNEYGSVGLRRMGRKHPPTALDDAPMRGVPRCLQSAGTLE
jgi:hypothetical protein